MQRRNFKPAGGLPINVSGSESNHLQDTVYVMHSPSHTRYDQVKEMGTQEGKRQVIVTNKRQGNAPAFRK